jgi:hypothetical protein
MVALGGDRWAKKAWGVSELGHTGVVKEIGGIASRLLLKTSDEPRRHRGTEKEAQ